MQRWLTLLGSPSAAAAQCHTRGQDGCSCGRYSSGQAWCACPLQVQPSAAFAARVDAAVAELRERNSRIEELCEDWTK